jgi:hypothetical protein
MLGEQLVDSLRDKLLGLGIRPARLGGHAPRLRRTSSSVRRVRAGDDDGVTDSTDDHAIARLRRAVGAIERATRDRSPTGTSHDDADGVVGSIATDSAIGFDPFPVLAALGRHAARVVVMGQVAGIMHGSTDLTGDLDLLWDGDVNQSPRLAAAFASLSATLTDAEGVPVPCTAEAFELPKASFTRPPRTATAVRRSCDGASSTSPASSLAPKRAHGRDGLVVPYVSASDLLTMRRAVRRPKDLRRNHELELLLGMATHSHAPRKR